MLDGLRREFPEVVTLVRGLPHPRGIAMGFAIVRRATRTWWTLGIVALVVGAEYVLLSLPLFVSQILLARGTNLIGPFDLLAYFSPVFTIGAAVIVLYMAAARRVSATERA